MAENQNVFSDAKILDEEFNKLLIRNYSTRPNQKSAYGPGLNATQTQDMFDAAALHIKGKHNKLIAALEAIGPAETERINAEQTRAQNEEDRQAAEQARAQNEEDRDAAEQDRENAEESRRIAEFERNKKDSERNAKIEHIEKLVGDIDAALDLEIKAQEALIGGGA